MFVPTVNLHPCILVMALTIETSHTSIFRVVTVMIAKPNMTTLRKTAFTAITLNIIQ